MLPGISYDLSSDFVDVCLFFVLVQYKVTLDINSVYTTYK